MRKIVIWVKGDSWNDESEADDFCEEVVHLLDKGDFPYNDVTIQD